MNNLNINIGNTRRTFSVRFKRAVVQDIRINNLTYEQASGKYNVAVPTIGKWYRGIEGLKAPAIATAIHAQRESAKCVPPISENPLSILSKLIEKRVDFAVSYKEGKPFVTVAL